jgi:hypothetical protein
MLAFVKSLTYCEILLVTLFRGSEASTLTMKTLTGIRVGSEKSYHRLRRTCTVTIIRIFLESNEGCMGTGENQPMTDREADTEIMMWLPEYFLELVSVFKEAIKNFIIYLPLKKI